MELDEKTDRTQPDIQNLSRFAMTTGSLFCVIVIAGGTLEGEWKSAFLPLKLSHSEFLIYLFPLLAVYAAWRYWYYGIHLPLTRQKIREYMKKPKSILICTGLARDFGPTGQPPKPDSIEWQARKLTEDLPQGLDSNEVLFFSGRYVVEMAEAFVKLIVAKRAQKYFSGLRADEVLIENPSGDTFSDWYWARVSPTTLGTRARVALEDLDLWSPVILNFVGFVLLLTSLIFCWPSSLCVYGK